MSRVNCQQCGRRCNQGPLCARCNEKKTRLELFKGVYPTHNTPTKEDRKPHVASAMVGFASVKTVDGGGIEEDPNW